MIEGGCFCRAVRFRIDAGKYFAANCHCTMCRRIHGAPYVTWLEVPAERFRHLGASPKTLASSEHGTRAFCADCGSQLTCVNDEHPDVVHIAVGALDSAADHAPVVEVYSRTRLPWVGDRLPNP